MLFDVSSAGPDTPLELARYWAARRGRGEPTAAEVEREQVWEAIVRAHERGEGVEALLLRDGDGWIAAIGVVRATVPERDAALAEPRLQAGHRWMKVASFDRVLEKLELRPFLPGEPGSR